MPSYILIPRSASTKPFAQTARIPSSSPSHILLASLAGIPEAASLETATGTPKDNPCRSWWSHLVHIISVSTVDRRSSLTSQRRKVWFYRGGNKSFELVSFAGRRTRNQIQEPCSSRLLLAYTRCESRWPSTHSPLEAYIRCG